MTQQGHVLTKTVTSATKNANMNAKWCQQADKLHREAPQDHFLKMILMIFHHWYYVSVYLDLASKNWTDTNEIAFTHSRINTVPSRCHLSTGTPLKNSSTLLPWKHTFKPQRWSLQCPRANVARLLPDRTFRAVEKNRLVRAWHCLKEPQGIGLRGNQDKMLRIHLVPCCSHS